MSEFTYYGIQVQQTPESKPFYLIAAPATEILSWADVPRKQENFLAGYQRQLNDRHTTITDFLNQPDSGGKNILPSSIIIAADANKIKISDESKSGLVRITINVEQKDTPELLEETLAHFRKRLGKEELDSINLQNSDDLTDEDQDSDQEEIPPDSYLARVVQQLEKCQGNLDSLDPKFRVAVEEYLVGVSKPGLILDGQHRVHGAKDVSAFSVNLPVVLMPGLDVSEQVFHFYILNNKARPLNKTELRSIIATSLSNEEIAQLYNRFLQAGVTAEETTWSHKMNTDKDSPFEGLVDFKLNSKSNAPIDENVAYQVVTKFLKLGKKYRLLYTDVNDWGTDIQGHAEFRLKIFYALWRAVKAKYPNAWTKAVADGGGQILQKVNLLVLQEFLLDGLVGGMPKRKAKNEPSPLSDPDLIFDEVRFLLEFLSEEFYTKGWKMKGLDTGVGHKAFRESLEEAVSSQSQNLGNRKLFKEPRR